MSDTSDRVGGPGGEGGKDLARRKAEREPKTMETARRISPRGRESKRDKPARNADR